MLSEWVYSCPYTKYVVSGVYICKIRTEDIKKDKNLCIIGKFCDKRVCPQNPIVINGKWKFKPYQTTLNKFK